MAAHVVAVMTGMLPDMLYLKRFMATNSGNVMYVVQGYCSNI